MKQLGNLNKFLFMLIAIFMMTMVPATLCAQNTQAEKKVVIKATSATVESILTDIKKQTGLSFAYSTDVSKTWPKVTMNIQNKSVREVLDELMGYIGCEYKISGNVISISKQQLSGKMRIVSGMVRDQEGLPLPGVPVCIGETRVCTVTDDEGRFSFQIPTEKTTLKFSYVGMQTQYVSILAGNADVKKNIKMLSDVQLDNVVVTGIFRKAKESYTGAVSSISSEQLGMYRGQNLLQTLKNVDASINFAIDNVNGSNPNSIPEINIRGNSSLPMSVEEFNQGQRTNINTPLVIMDGFEISITKLMDYNDEEIESINILKDAAATAIYGSRGANGVIVVVSKQPEAGKLRVNVEAGLNFEVPDLSSYHLLNAADKLEVERRAGLYDLNWSTSTSSSTSDMLYKQAYYDRRAQILSGVDVDWMAKPLHLGVGQRYNARFEGGSNEFRWSTDLQYKVTEGAMKGSSRKNFNGGITLLYKFKTLTFRNYTSIGINHSDESNYGSFSDYVRMQPYNTPYDKNGVLRMFLEPFSAIEDGIENPLYNAALNTINSKDYKMLTNNFSVDWNILPYLTMRGQLGVSNTVSTSDYFLPAEHTYFSSPNRNGEYDTPEGYMRRGLYRYGNTESTTFNADVTLAFNKIFAERHSLYAGVNWSLLTSKSDGFNIALEGFANSDAPKIANARQHATNIMPSGNNSTRHQFGVTGNVNYTYNSRYYLDLSYRVDGNSMYGSKEKYSSFWSTGLGWNVHQENFIKNIKELNMLRLKFSYGQTGSATGSSDTDAYTYFKYVTDNRYMNSTGAVLGGFGNPNLTWQTTKSTNFGIEFGLLDNRIKGQFDCYVKNTSNLLSSMDLPQSMGFTSYRANVGEVKNTGFEAALQGFIIKDRERDINWMIGGQLVYNKNRITHLSDAIKAQTAAYMLQDATSDEYSGIQNLFFEGDPQYSIYAVRSLGIDPSTGKETYLDKDGNITEEWHASDKVFLGSAEPTFRGNLNTMFQWKDLTFNIGFNYYWGGKIYNSTLRDRVEVTLNTLKYYNVDERVLTSRWYEVGDRTFFSGLSNNRPKATSRYVMDNNVLELSSISIQYKLHNAWLSRNFHLQTAIFAVNMNDIAHWGTVKMERGISYPFARNILASVKLMF